MFIPCSDFDHNASVLFPFTSGYGPRVGHSLKSTRSAFFDLEAMIPRGDEQTVGSGSGTSGSTRTASSGVGLPTGCDGLRPGGVVHAYGNPVNLSNMEKLRGRENYASWAFAMKMTLIREGSWRAVKPLEGQAVDLETSERA